MTNGKVHFAFVFAPLRALRELSQLVKPVSRKVAKMQSSAKTGQNTAETNYWRGNLRWETYYGVTTDSLSVSETVPLVAAMTLRPATFATEVTRLSGSIGLVRCI
jgi:hypothetical protein